MKALEILHNYPSKTGMYIIYSSTECNEAIKELETLKHNHEMQMIMINDYKELLLKNKYENKTCKSCNKYELSWDNSSYYCEEGIVCPPSTRNSFSCNKYEAKENK